MLMPIPQQINEVDSILYFPKINNFKNESFEPETHHHHIIFSIKPPLKNIICIKTEFDINNFNPVYNAEIKQNITN